VCLPGPLEGADFRIQLRGKVDGEENKQSMGIRNLSREPAQGAGMVTDTWPEKSLSRPSLSTAVTT